MNTKSFNHDFTYESYKNTISRKIYQCNRYRSFKDVDKQEQHYFRNVKIDIIEENNRIKFKSLYVGIYEYYCSRILKWYRRNRMCFNPFSDLRHNALFYKPFFHKRMWYYNGQINTF